MNVRKMLAKDRNCSILEQARSKNPVCCKEPCEVHQSYICCIYCKHVVNCTRACDSGVLRRTDNVSRLLLIGSRGSNPESKRFRKPPKLKATATNE